MKQSLFNYGLKNQQPMQKLAIEPVKPEGLKYGAGSISREEIVKDVPEQLAKLYELLDSGDILVAVDKDENGNMLDDDGCGDGRGVKRVYQKQRDKIVEKTKSLNRAKVFGGGPAMAGAALVATGESIPQTGEEFFAAGVRALKMHHIEFGAHTDDHAVPPNCGCGAIDNCPAIMRNSVSYHQEIRADIKTLGIPALGLDDVLDRFGAAAEHISRADYSGQSVMDGIVDSGKVVKQLIGDHKEVAVLLNMVSGYTVDQVKVRNLTDGTLQVFAVDVWRLQDIAARLYPENEQKQLTALQGMLVYTLATAATLTKGNLPVYRTEAAKELVTA